MLSREHSFILIAYACILICSSVDTAVAFTIKQLSIATSPTLRRHPTSLAAKGGGKKKKPKRATAQTTKGFGAPPPKLDDVLAAFQTRIPKADADAAPCPCGTGKVYGECCGPLHNGDRVCSTMTDVLRSRYSAFSWRNVKYVMSTTHPSCRDYREDSVAWAKDLNKGGMFDSYDFVNLEAGDEEMSEENENEGFVEFKVTLRAKEDGNGSVAGGETVISERSRFLRDPADGSWSYASGDVRSDVAGLEDTKLNA
mmetsp:Transcript_30341/g.44310  ORF Transcript_30341/g.44310 Transcript_30341/m.44310 type:complete len:255 (+) Transcript_30341:158-922(+)